MKKIIWCLICLLWAYPAYSYIDLGIGSMIIQGIIASFMVLMMYFRQVIAFVKQHIFKTKKKDNIDE